MKEQKVSRECSVELERDTVGELVAALVRKYGVLPAIADKVGQATFVEIDARSKMLARALLAAGVSKGARVGMRMPTGQDFLIALFATMRIGGVAVLISTLARPPELAHMIRTADVDILLSADSYLRNDYVALLEQALPSLGGAKGAGRLALTEAPFLRAIWFWGMARRPWARNGAEEIVHLADVAGIGEDMVLAVQKEVVPADPALIIFTSGSSAEPKAVVHSQGNVVRQARALSRLMTCEPGDRILSTLPFFWVGGLFTVVLGALCCGTAVICPDDPSLDGTVAGVLRWKATHIMHWPQQLDMMKGNPQFAAALARMKPAYAHQFNLFGLAPAGLTANSLGMTETLGPHSMCPPAPLPQKRAGSYGVAVGGIERRIIDPETGTELPPGAPGVLCLRGGALMTGMHRKEHGDVFDGQGFYRTDDICSIDEDGHLFFVGRGGDLVKISGANVSPVEVEAAIRSISGIKAACVVGIPVANQGDTLVAAVVAEEDAVVPAEDLRARLKMQLSSYKVPRHFVFLREEEIPMTASAKIYKPELRRLLAARIAT